MSEQALFRLRVRYVKRGRLRYLGHLEVLHTLERACRRAELPYAVTQGFSPHMRTGYSAALPVGTASTCEWFDVFLTELVSARDAMARLTRALPDDLAPVEVGYVDVRAQALTAFITRAVYEVRFHFAREVSADAVRSTLYAIASAGSLPYLRGKKEKLLDLTRTLSGFDVVTEASDQLLVTLDTRMDNEGALRPEILVAALNNHLAGCPDAEIHSTGIQNFTEIVRYEVTRTAQSAIDEEGNPVSPLACASTATV